MPTFLPFTGWRLIWSDREGFFANINMKEEFMCMESNLFLETLLEDQCYLSKGL